MFGESNVFIIMRTVLLEARGDQVLLVAWTPGGMCSGSGSLDFDHPQLRTWGAAWPTLEVAAA